MSTAVTIEKAKNFDLIWPIFKKIVTETDSFIYDANISKSEAERVWMGPEVYLAKSNNSIIATFRIRPNQVQRGNHIANASFMVDPQWQGQGIGKMIGQFAIKKAKELGYLGMQFNMVVKHNQKSLNLWLSLGFEIIGILPKAYQMPNNSYTDAYIVFKSLE